MRRAQPVAPTFALIAAAGLAAALPSVAFAQTFPEIEPNNDKAAAVTNGPFLLAAGQGVSGFTIGSNPGGPEPETPDYFLIKTAPAAPGIYRHQLVLTSTIPAPAASIRGTGQNPVALGPWPCAVGSPSGTDAAAQGGTVMGAGTIVQWYGFGNSEELVYRVAGTANTTAEYIATLQTQPITPVDIGTFQAGEITITQVDQGHSTDGDMWIYDANFNAIVGYGNDGGTIQGGAPGPSTPGVHLRRMYEAGTYYIALTNFNLANDQGSPCDDSWRSDTILDFPGAVLNNTTSVGLDLSFAVIDSQGTTPVVAAKNEPFEIAWFRFEVTGSVETGRCCYPDGTCEVVTPQNCAGASGVYGGAATECAGFTCPQPGACCFNDLSCQILSEGQCAAAAGVYQGHGTACGTCPAPPAGTYIWSGPLVIPDGITNGICGDIAPVEFNIAQGGSVNDVTIAVYITHTWQGDLRFRLRHLHNNIVVPLVDRPGVGVGGSLYGFANDNFGASSSTLMRFIDTGSSQYHNPPLTTGIDDVSGDWLPLTPLNAMLGFPAAGTWRLEVEDCADSFTGQIEFVMLQLDIGSTCYANCDGSTVTPVLNVDDFTCFINEFASAQSLPPGQQQTSYANCDGSSVEPMLNVDDFTCFINEFAGGCR